MSDHRGDGQPTNRVFLLGAGFSKPGGLPLANELLERVLEAARKHMAAVDGYNHLEADIERYERFLADTEPSRPFDLEEFGAWLDWEHVLRLRGSETWYDEGNESSLQLRWAIGHVLHNAMPATVPAVFREFARRLTTSDTVPTLNYDLLLEGALDEVGLPYRRFPDRYTEVYDTHANVDNYRPPELAIRKSTARSTGRFSRCTLGHNSLSIRSSRGPAIPMIHSSASEFCPLNFSTPITRTETTGGRIGARPRSGPTSR